MLHRISLTSRSLTFVLLCALFTAAGAHAQSWYEEQLAKAEQAYNEGFFDRVIEVVKSCLNKGGLSTAEQAWAYKLLGQAYVSKNDFELAKLCVQKLVAVAPDYEPDRDQDLSAWIELVEAAKQGREAQIQQPPLPDDKPVARADSTRNGRSKKWLWIGGGGALVTAGIIYMLVSQKETTGPQMPPPDGRPY